MARGPLPHQNRLAAEPSPYLLQHAANPVDWWPWGEGAFAEAKRRDVPVFLSVGYATCHWCHVMAHESFEDEAVAALMNDAFVSIKVDREERPDVDDLYMAVCQATTGSGGWPLTVILTPDKRPFFTGTYFPKESRHGRIGMLDLVPRVKEAWKTQRDALSQQGQQFLDHVGKPEPDEAELGPEVLELCERRLTERYDADNGGFGSAPKFPSPHNLLFLLRRHAKKPDPTLLDMVVRSLHAMADGGIHDHLGGGFHRYSTDRHWLLPHFEKMLYDQSMLAFAYAEAYHATGERRFADVTRDILDYVLRDLRDPDGGFRCAEDADSEGEEGRFYVWTKAEILAVLGKDEGAAFCKAYNVTEEGNFVDEATHRHTGANVLHLSGPMETTANNVGTSPVALDLLLRRGREKLVTVRSKRVRPLLDDKVLTDWNGLAVAAFAKAGAVLQEPRYTAAAIEATDFLWREMRKDGRLLHRYKAGKTDGFAFLEDHAFILWGLLELYDATLDAQHLDRAVTVARDLQHFQDKTGGFYQAPDDGEDLGVRRKEAYDGAIPSGNSVAAWCLLRLAHMTGDTKWRDLSDGVMRAFSGMLSKHPYGFTMMAIALDYAIGPTRELLIAGNGTDGDTLVATVRSRYRPDLVLLRASPKLADVAPWTTDHHPKGKAAAFLCENFACRTPVETPDALKAILEK